MSGKIAIDLVKPAGEGSSRTFHVPATALDAMSVGGREGKKYKMVVENPLAASDLSLHRGELVFVIKAYETFTPINLARLEAIARSYTELFKRGYPTPSTARVFVHEDRCYLAMSDMTEDGAYLLWGYNDYPTKEEIITLREMNITADDMKEIKQQALRIAEKATDDGIIIHWASYHVRRHRQTQAIQVILLDVGTRVWDGYNTQEVVSGNQSAVSMFLNELTTRLQARPGAKPQK
jgi:hypothetical protein